MSVTGLLAIFVVVVVSVLIVVFVGPDE